MAANDPISFSPAFQIDILDTIDEDISLQITILKKI